MKVRIPHALGIAALASGVAASTAQTATTTVSSLYSFTVGGKPVTPCAVGDPLHIARNPQIQKAMTFLEIPSEAVSFKGCKGQPFSASEVTSPSGSVSYIITYPSEITTYLAPIIHELAHVAQMRLAGSLLQLRALSSERIELGADFLVGLTFAQVLPEADVKMFQNNLSLIGLYYERHADAHGRPDHRTSSFRRGLYLYFPDHGRSVRRANEAFQGNFYGQIKSF